MPIALDEGALIYYNKSDRKIVAPSHPKLNRTTVNSNFIGRLRYADVGIIIQKTDLGKTRIHKRKTGLRFWKRKRRNCKFFGNS